MVAAVITLKLLADNFYHLFKGKEAPRVRHMRTLTWGDSTTFQGTATGSKGMYTMDIALEKDPEGKVSFVSPVTYVKCSCPAFQYYVQDPLAKVGSTHPGTGHVNKRINNPAQIAAPCKHLYAYIQLIMQKGLLNNANMRSARTERK